MKSTLHPFQTDDPQLRPVHEKVLAEQALEVAEITALYASKDILAIGWLANFVRERMHGNATRFAVNTISNEGDAGEVLVVANGLDATLRVVERARKANPQATISAFTVEELAALANPEEIAQQVRNAGADSLLGDGAEIFLPELRRRIWHHAPSFGKRSEARKAAIAAGLKTPFYIVQRGSSPAEQAQELLTFRERKAESFAAVSFDPDATTSATLNATTGMQEMKHIAIARLALPNMTHIRAYWQMLGGKLIQIALRFGASELDGTSLEGTIDPESRSRELAREISVAGREPKAIAPVRKIVVNA